MGFLINGSLPGNWGKKWELKTLFSSSFFPSRIISEFYVCPAFVRWFCNALWREEELIRFFRCCFLSSFVFLFLVILVTV
jgi:hypothetical protein